jgi:hypothetical protein
MPQLQQSFRYEHCDVPDGVSLAEWRARRARESQRRAQVTGGVLAAVATLAPIVLSVRGSRTR